ncbi:MAG TPA: PepSY domain-containing protein [Anaerolineaceae bacterium]|nr:PepSY domain-containing protein [Anaerolineaceae bacterium]
MKPSKALLFSLLISAVILIIAAGMTSLVMTNNKSQARETEYQQLIAQESQQINQDNQQLAQAYLQFGQANQRIDQANQQIQQANAEILAMQSQLSQAQTATGKSAPAQASSTTSGVNAPAGSGATISPDQATQAALRVVDIGQAVLKPATLVNYQGQVAYEVAFEKGLVYVDASSGEILFNGTVPAQINADMAAQIASNYLNNKNILQGDQVTVGNRQLYRVIFKNGYFVFLDLTGQITNINPPEITSTNQSVSSTSGGGSSSSGGGHSTSHSDDGGGDD